MGKRFSRLSRFLLKWALVIVVAILIAGAVGFIRSEGGHWLDTKLWPSALYRSLQMFGLNFELRDGVDGPDMLLEIARFSAAALLFAGALTVLARPLLNGFRLLVRQAPFRQNYVVVLGYGPVGQAIARQESRNGFSVVAVDLRSDTERHTLAGDDNVLLMEGDASKAEFLRKTLAVHRACRVHISLSSDMATLDATRLVKELVISAIKSAGSQKTVSIRPFFNDPELVRRMSEAGEGGLSSTRELTRWSVSQLAAEDFVAAADLGRTALEAGQDRVHLILFGCGGLGASILQETLLTTWSVGLKPPAISVFDRRSRRIERDLRRLAPALFADAGAAAVPLASRPVLSFARYELEDLDFTGDAKLKEIVSSVPATAFVIATGDDNLNLKAALALEQAMLRMKLSPAPIYVRIWSGNRDEAASAGFDATSIVRQFGSLEQTIEGSLALAENPDAAAVEINGYYEAASRYFNPSGDRPQSPEQAWNELSATKRLASRRLFRSVPSKLQDLGLQWRGSVPPLPGIDGGLVARFCATEEVLDYLKLESGKALPPDWLREGASVERGKMDQSIANTIKDIAIVEHDRWMTERALDGWMSAGKYDKALRDDQRKIHHCMVDWRDLHGNDAFLIRRFDAALLRGIVEQRKYPQEPVKSRHLNPSYARKSVALTLTLLPQEGRQTEYGWAVYSADSFEQPVTEVRIRLDKNSSRSGLLRSIASRSAAERLSSNSAAAGDELIMVLNAWRNANGATTSLCRVVFEFSEPGQMLLSQIVQPLVLELRAEAIEVSSVFKWRL